VYEVGVSGPDGHFEGELRLSAGEIEELPGGQEPTDGFLPFEALTRPDDERRFVGRAQLVGPTGLSLISDIDDTIKHSQVGDPQAVLTNTFLRQFTAVPGMPELYRQCAQRGVVFHYVSGSPWQLYLPLAEFLVAAGLPAGSFDLKHFRLKDSSMLSLLQSQEAFKVPAIERIMTRFPHRKFVLIGDSGEQDPEIYAQVARQHGAQIAAILIRNVTGEQIDNARFEAVRKGLGDLPIRLFDQPSEVQPLLEELWGAQGQPSAVR
jgi:hypothetical protein